MKVKCLLQCLVHGRHSLYSGFLSPNAREGKAEELGVTLGSLRSSRETDLQRDALLTGNEESTICAGNRQEGESVLGEVRGGSE